MRRRLLSLWFPNGLPNALPNGLNEGGPAADLASLALWCQAFSPLTAAEEPDGVCIDITGCAHLFGGEAGLRARLLARFAGARVAVADSALAAWGLARFGEGDGEDLTDLPLAALRLDDRTIAKLRRVGIRRVGELMRLPRAELTAGYGAAPVRRLAEALGQAPEILRFVNAPPEWREILHFAEPIFAPASLQAALGRLAEGLCGRLAEARLGATRLTALFYRVDSRRPEIGLNFAAPCRDAAQMTKLLQEKLQAIDPGFGVEAMSLEAAACEPLGPVQLGMDRPAPDYAGPTNVLLNRLGSARLWRVAARQSHVPERVTRRRPVHLPPVPWGAPKYPRPLTLLERPDEIQAVAPVPDDPPVLFSWRGKSHRIRRATGPERIGREWWRHAPEDARPEVERVRDYYAVEDVEGQTFWVFRAGMHEGVGGVRWFIHGFFG